MLILRQRNLLAHLVALLLGSGMIRLNRLWEIAVHLAVAYDVNDGVFFVLSFFPRDVLDEILNLIESVSEGFPTYSLTEYVKCRSYTAALNFTAMFFLNIEMLLVQILVRLHQLSILTRVCTLCHLK